MRKNSLALEDASPPRVEDGAGGLPGATTEKCGFSVAAPPPPLSRARRLVK
uniref:Uncharacterized protein n=1 Tax=uncultured Armatimonadetes bacterium TaxID=157466 RepID=A0A6J4HAI6_9BACT|nr:hypothetical protein AVDCRST_MAG63-257 [uncultured Armatimonadetes bacterium]